MSFYNMTKTKKIQPEIRNKKDVETLNSSNYAHCKTETNTNTNINSFNTTLNNNIENKNILSNINHNESVESDDKNNEYDYNNQIIDNQNDSDNPTNIDNIIKNQISSAVVDSFLNQHQIKSLPMFILYLSEIWRELSKEVNSIEKGNFGINLFAFSKYYNLPGLIGQRLFNIFDLDNNNFLSAKEFITGMCTLFCEEINSLMQFIFNFYDFDYDEYINFDDVHAVLSYLPIINGFDDMIDIEEEIFSTIGDIFINKKEKIDYSTFYDLIIRKERYELFIPLISFLYDNKPFNNEEIKEFYIGYYNLGKINDIEGNYKINDVINLKESETKDEIKSEDIITYNSIFKGKNICKIQKKKLNFFENDIYESTNHNKTELNLRLHFYDKKFLNNNKKEIKNENKKDEYEKYVLNSHGFEQMRKSIPLVIGNSSILNNKPKFNGKNYKKLVDLKKTKSRFESGRKNNFKKRKSREGSIIYSFCQNIIKGTCNTFNNKLENDTEESELDSFQNSVSFKYDTKLNNIGEFPWKKNNINNQRIKCESYLYKITKSGKLKKLYFRLHNSDLFFYKDENSKTHKGMHNLSTYFLEIKPPFVNDIININNNNNKEYLVKTGNLKDCAYRKNIDGIDYYCFLLINIKSQIHYYYTPDISIYEKWVKSLKVILKYKNIFDKYIFREIIGKGKNCLVFSAYDTYNKRDVAIKKINKSFLTLEDLTLIQTEIDTLKVCQHPYVVKLYEIIETFNEVNIVLEYCELGNLYSYLSKINFQLSEEQIAKCIQDISKAVYSMHNLGIIHRDLKLSNIALTKKNNEIEIRILDFGFSKILGPNQFCNEGYGTPGYAAPEVISRYNYSFEADVWSIGVITYFLCSGKLPFDYVRYGCDQKDIIENTLLDDVKFDRNMIQKYSKYAIKFMRELMNKNTYQRPNIREVLEHEWFKLYFKNEVKQRIVNTYKNEFYQNPNIDDIYTCDDNIDKDNNKGNCTNFLLYTSINKK